VLGPWRAALILVALVTGCGGSSVPEGKPIAVRFEVIDPGQFANAQGVRIPQPLTVHQTDTEWPRVSQLLPDQLPEPVDQGDECLSGFMVSVRASSGGEVDYGPCEWPKELKPVRLLMHTLLRRELAAERRCDCP